MADPPDLQAPLTWTADEIEGMRLRVRELMAQGRPRSVASQVAFGELCTRRAVHRAQDTARIEPEPPPEAA